MSDNRFGSIGDILNKPPREPRTTAPLVEPESTDEDADQNTDREDATITAIGANRKPQSGNAAPSTPRRKPASSQATGGTRRIAFRLDPDLHAALTARAAAQQSSHGQVVLDAIEHTYPDGRLAERIKAAGDATGTGMFPRLASRGVAQPTIPVEIRLHAQAVTILDELTTELGADNRTQLLTTALSEHLLDQLP